MITILILVDLVICEPTILTYSLITNQNIYSNFTLNSIITLEIRAWIIYPVAITDWKNPLLNFAGKSCINCKKSNGVQFSFRSHGAHHSFPFASSMIISLANWIGNLIWNYPMDQIYTFLRVTTLKIRNQRYMSDWFY